MSATLILYARKYVMLSERRRDARGCTTHNGTSPIRRPVPEWRSNVKALLRVQDINYLMSVVQVFSISLTTFSGIGM